MFGDSLAHRVSYELFHREKPNIVRHKCDVRRCVNPEHLVSGTPQENVQDMINRGRAPHQVRRRRRRRNPFCKEFWGRLWELW